MYMLQSGAEINLENPMDKAMTVLHYACRNGTAEYVKTLLMVCIRICMYVYVFLRNSGQFHVLDVKMA